MSERISVWEEIQWSQRAQRRASTTSTTSSRRRMLQYSVFFLFLLLAALYESAVIFYSHGRTAAVDAASMDHDAPSSPRKSPQRTLMDSNANISPQPKEQTTTEEEEAQNINTYAEEKAKDESNTAEEEAQDGNAKEEDQSESANGEEDKSNTADAETKDDTDTQQKDPVGKDDNNSHSQNNNEEVQQEAQENEQQVDDSQTQKAEAENARDFSEKQGASEPEKQLEQPQTPLSRQDPPQQPERKRGPVIMTNFLFGKGIAHARRFRMFVESAKYSGFDFGLIGDTKPPFELPPNFQWVNITWPGLAELVFEKVFNGTRVNNGNLAKAEIRKVNDLKPLAAVLFPDLVAPYQWWGWCDNDMTMGNLTKFVPQEALDNYDMILGRSARTWGPWTLLRNAPKTNWLFSQTTTPQPLAKIIANMQPGHFDEWGKKDKNMPTSMTGHMRTHAARLGIRYTDMLTSGYRDDRPKIGDYRVWDKNCPFMYGWIKDKALKHNITAEAKIIPKRCGEVIWDKGTLTRRTDGKEIYMAHWQKNKRMQEPTLANDTKFELLVKADKFKVSYLEGFDFVTDNSLTHLKA